MTNDQSNRNNQYLNKLVIEILGIDWSLEIFAQSNHTNPFFIVKQTQKHDTRINIQFVSRYVYRVSHHSSLLEEKIVGFAWLNRMIQPGVDVTLPRT